MNCRYPITARGTFFASTKTSIYDFFWRRKYTESRFISLLSSGSPFIYILNGQDAYQISKIKTAVFVFLVLFKEICNIGLDFENCRKSN